MNLAVTNFKKQFESTSPVTSSPHEEILRYCVRNAKNLSSIEIINISLRLLDKGKTTKTILDIISKGNSVLYNKIVENFAERKRSTTK